MKKLGIVVVVLAAVLLVAPFGIGKVAEKRLDRGLDKLVEQAPYLKITERTWSGGWFRSTQTVTFELADSIAGKLPQKVIEEILKQEAAQAEAAMDAEGTDAQAGEGADMDADTDADVDTDADADSDADADAGGDAEIEEPTQEAPARLTVRNEVLHGPILGAAGLGLARVDTHFELSEQVRKSIREVFGEKPALEVRTRVGFFGGGTTLFKSEGRKLNIKDKDDVDFTYETFKLSVGISRNADSYEIEGGLPSLVVKDGSGEANFAVTGLTVDGDAERVMGDLYDGEFAFKIKEIKIKGKDSPDEVVVQDTHYVVDTSTENDFVDMSAKLGTGAVKSEQIKQAGVEIREIHYDFSLRHLHAPTLEKMAKSMRAMYSMPIADPAQAPDAIFGPMKEHAGELLRHDPVFGIDRIGLVTPDGEIVARGVIKLVGATPEDFAGAGSMALIGKLHADLTIEAAQKVLEKFPNGATMAGGAVDAGYAKREGEKLVCHIVFKDGQLTINDKPQAIPGLGGPPPGAMPDGAMDEGMVEEESEEAAE